MRGFAARNASRFVLGVSTLALTGMAMPAAAQETGSPQTKPDANATMGQPGTSRIPAGAARNDETPKVGNEQVTNDIIVTGIRASLRATIDLKRDAQGIVDGISAEDIGKFPDTNLAESLQRITGVSIDRANGEGSFVTVRGFGPEFNLVTLNGRYMPTATLGDSLSAPSSRSFDFANLASEGVASLEVYKSGRASVASGGIGSTINIRTPRPFDKPGFRAAISGKGVADTSRNHGTPITPEVSGIFSDTFADDRIGVLVTGTYQKRLASVDFFTAGYRDGYLGSENNWGSLAQPGDPRAANVTNRPGATDVYQVPQNAAYDIQDLKRERINGQAVLQYRPTDTLTATADYTYSRNTVTIHDSSVGIWFNHNDTTSAWTDGPVAGPLFYSEHFNQNEAKDLAYSGALTSSRTENKSLGGNLTWKGIEGLTLTLDGHHSTATAKPVNKYGSSVSVGNAIFGIENQTIDFDHYIPSIQFQMYPGINPLDASLITPTGNAFRSAYFRDRINQGQLQAHYEVGRLLDSIDAGFSYVDNKVRSAYGYIQNDTWGGAGPASDIPDDIFHLESIPGKFKGLSGINTPGTVSQFYTFDFKRMVSLIDGLYGTCGGDNDCRTPFTVDRRITERTYAPYIQVNGKADLFGRPAHLIAGVRYEKTNVDSSALVPIPTGTRWVSANEFDLIFSDQGGFTTLKGNYDNWLPAFDFDFQPLRNVKLRASYSHTITRADYGSLQGGQTLDQLFRIDNGFGSQGNPNLIPYKSKNIDLSAEWYYTRDSYLSVGFFHKNVSNFIGQTRVNTPAFGLTNPADGPRFDAAIAALGPNATTTDIRNYIFANFPDTTANAKLDPATGNYSGDILGTAQDNPLIFQINQPINSDQTAKLHGFEFALQHNFWNTGFGTILNYTIVRGSARYDNQLPASVTQFALTGLSDSANAVLFYEKHGISLRAAYNWRAGFLAATGPNPTYVESFGQLDVQASYQLTPKLNVFMEGINVNSESRRLHARSSNNVTLVQPGAPRWYFGARYVF